MKNIVIMALEPIETRYTGQWHKSIPKSLDDKDINVIQIDGDTNSGKPTKGAFLDFVSTNQWKSEQLIKLANLIQDGTIKDGDAILYTDAWNPTILQVKYMLDLLKLKVDIHGIWHAGQYDPQDFLGRLIEDKRWAKNTERAIYHALDYNYFATDFHIELFKKGVLKNNNKNEKLYKSGQPHDLLIETLSNFPKQTKHKQIIFPHRLAPEKQLDIFNDLAKSMHDVEFIICQDKHLTKDEYHKFMAESMITFSANLQETFGITSALEGPLLNTIPIVPDRLSYTEIFKKYPEFKYPSEWTENFEVYKKNKDKLILFLYNVLNNYDDYNKRLEQYKNNELRLYGNADTMFKKIIGE